MNIFLNGDGAVVADAWFIASIGTEGGLNDGETHHIELRYTAAESLWELYLGDDLAEEAVWEYSRDPSLDRTRIGGLSNPDFGFEIDEGMDGLAVQIDNFIIEAPAPPPLVATIDRATGGVVVESIVGDDLNFSEFQINSSAGSLNSEGWTSISGNYDGAGDSSVSGSNWNIESETVESLLEKGDGGKFTPGQTLDLGAVWLSSPIEDVEIAVFNTDEGEVIRGAVNYTGDPLLFGDLNSDGDLNGLDWDQFVSGFGSDLAGRTGRESYFLADLNGDGVHDSEDFIEFSIAYDAVHGEGALAALASVPEPASVGLFGLGVLGVLSFRRTRNNTKRLGAFVVVLAIGSVLIGGQSAQADLLVEYTFDGNTNDTSGNNRHGMLDEGIFGDGAPEVANGQLSLTGEIGESMVIPIDSVNPFDGSSDFTIDLSFTALEHEDEAGHLLISSADFTNPTEGENHSMSLFIEPEGDIVYDNYFVGEVRVTPPEFVIDALKHDLRLTYKAPPLADDPGTMAIRVDGTWLGFGEIAPSVPDIGNHEVRLGSSLNEEFPFECGEGECFIREFLGDLDDVRIYDEAFMPTQISAEIDRSNGDVRFLGGEFARAVKYYELSSEGGALNAAAWGGSNLDAQNLDGVGEGRGQTWDPLAGTENRLVEAFLLGSTVFDDGKSVTLGGVWNGQSEDVELQVVTTSNETLSVDISFVGEGSGNQSGGMPPMALDCNGDGVVSAADLECANAGGITADLLADLNLIQGDLDGDGSVGFPDFLVLSANFGGAATYAGGDIDGDGSVGFPDFLVLSASFGQSAGAVATVPEPAAASLFTSCLMMLGVLRRRR